MKVKVKTERVPKKGRIKGPLSIYRQVKEKGEKKTV